MSTSTQRVRKLRRQTKHKPPFFKAAEIRDLAQRLHTSQFVVESVLHAAGHVLRERKRRRGDKPDERDNGVQGEPRVSRDAAAEAIAAVKVAAEYDAIKFLDGWTGRAMFLGRLYVCAHRHVDYEAAVQCIKRGGA